MHEIWLSIWLGKYNLVGTAPYSFIYIIIYATQASFNTAGANECMVHETKNIYYLALFSRAVPTVSLE